MNDPETDPRISSMRAPEFFVVITTADTTMEEISYVLGSHIDHQIELEQTGTLVAAGPWVNPDGKITGGLMIMRAASESEVRAAMDSDPFVTSGLFEFDVHRWKLNEGRLSLVVDLSGGTGRLE